MRDALLTVRHSAAMLYHHLRSWQQEIGQWRWYWRTYRQLAGSPVPPRLEAFRPSPDWLLPCLADATSQTPIEPIYYYQGCWAFERIVGQRPSSHVDVASDHFFVSLLSKVVPVTMIDIRPLALPLASLAFRRGSILEMPYGDGELESLSSMCVIEHIGLGRYGDPIDPLGTEKSMAELKRVVRPGGNLYLSVPLDDENRTYFNAHRAFTEPYLLELFRPFDVVDRKYIFGDTFGDEKRRGFGVGCYQLRRTE